MNMKNLIGKKLSAVIIALIISLAFSACEINFEYPDDSTDGAEETLTADNNNNDDETKEEEQEEIAEETADEKARGTRANPFAIGETAYYDGMDNDKSYLSYFAFAAEITATEVIRGVEAAAMFDNDPEEGKEFLLVKFSIKVTDTVFDEVVNLNNSRFDFVSQNGVKYGDLVSASGIKSLDDVYNGGETEGYAYCIIDEGDQTLIVFNESQNNGIWFSPNEIAE